MYSFVNDMDLSRPELSKNSVVKLRAKLLGLLEDEVVILQTRSLLDKLKA